MGSIAAGLAAFAFGFGSFMWLTDADPANAVLRAEPSDSSVTGTIRPQLAALDTTVVSEFALYAPDDQAQSQSARSSFSERFSFDVASAPWSLQRPQASPSFEDRFQLSQASPSFEDRFAGEAPPAAPVQSAAAPARTPLPRVAAAAAPRAAARAAVAQAAPKRSAAPRIQLASATDTPLPTAYAPTDSVKTSALTGSGLKDPSPNDSDPDGDTSHTAIYDITSHTVYLPNGRRLEAHSGLGGHMDDPRYAHMRMTGPTPPNVYKLKMRESLFHGVRAIRLVPTDDSKMHGRAGILAHTYMLGPNGQSNGCVSFSNYSAFLEAFERGEVTRLVVVERLAEAPPPRTASDWFKDIFRGS